MESTTYDVFSGVDQTVATLDDSDEMLQPRVGAPEPASETEPTAIGAGMTGGTGIETKLPVTVIRSRVQETRFMTSRIMVVDDDTALRITLQEILADEGRDVIAAEDGFQAIQRASEGGIALILMDIQMPGMNGVDAFLAIKEILPECVFVMMTGYAVEDLIQKALAEGAMTVLGKPVSIEEILEIMDEIIPVTNTF